MAPNKAARTSLAEALIEVDPELYRRYVRSRRSSAGVTAILKRSGVLRDSVHGSINTYSAFTEFSCLVRGKEGWAGLIVQSGIVTDASCKDLLNYLLKNNLLRSCLDFKNRRRIFEAVHSSTSFSLLTLGLSAAPARFLFGAETVDDLADESRKIRLDSEDLRQLNPLTGIVPPFKRTRDATLVLAAHRRFPVLQGATGRRHEGGWSIKTIGFPNVADDSGDFIAVIESTYRPADGIACVYEGKMVHHFDHRFADIASIDGATLERSERSNSDPTNLCRPRYAMLSTILDRITQGRWSKPWLLVWRDTARNDDQRTLISAIIPWSAPPRNNLPVLGLKGGISDALLLVSALSSFVVDFIARQKVAGAHVTRAHIEQLPVPIPSEVDLPLLGEQTASWVTKRAKELTFTAWDLAGESGMVAPYRWDTTRRELLRAELDAAFFHLYGIERDDVDYIMDTFPIVRRKDEAQYGEYRTKRLILEVYDRMTEAMASGEPYQTLLDPPPADPSLCHDPRTRPDWADLYAPRG